jgi:secretion/DNA translocation related CpaE-like protein
VVIAGSSGEKQQVLIVGSDLAIVDVVRRCAVACGIGILEAQSLARARSHWAGSAFIVLADDVIDDHGVDVAVEHPRLVIATRNSASALPWQLAVQLHADRVFDLSIDEPLLINYFTEQSRSRARVISVLAGSGGAGASVTAAALAMSARTGGHRSVLIDADPDSPGADLLLGLDQTPGLRWHHLSASSSPPPGEQLLSALPRSGDLAVITRDRSDRSILDTALVSSTVNALRGVADLIVVDLPRGGPETRAQIAAISEVVFLVLTCDLRGATSARSTVASLRVDADVRILARRSSSDTLQPMDVADWLELPLAAVLPQESGISSAIDRGEAICTSRRSRLLAECSGVLRGWLP